MSGLLSFAPLFSWEALAYIGVLSSNLILLAKAWQKMSSHMDIHSCRTAIIFSLVAK
jgi:hypothetical protein